MDQPLIVIRPSSLPGWNDCPRRGAAQLFRQHIEAAGYQLRKLTPNVGAVIGTANHRAAHLYIKGIIDGEPIDSGDAIEPALADMKERIAEGVAWDDITFGRNGAEEQVRRMTQVFALQVLPIVKPLRTEERLDADLGDGFVLSGQKDLLCAEPRQIRDLKGGRVQRANALQYGAYSLLERSHVPEPIDTLVEDFVQRVALSRPQPDVKQVVYPAPAAERAAARSIMAIKDQFRQFEHSKAHGGVEPADAFVANPMSQLCSPKFCPAWGTSFCRLHVGAK